MEQVGAYVAATGTITLADYAQLFATRGPELLQRGRPLGYQHTVATTWSLLMQRLREVERAAVGLLTLAAFLAPDDLPQPLLTAHAELLSEPLAATAADLLALGDAVAALRRFSLVRVVADGLYVHRLLQTVVGQPWMLFPNVLWRPRPECQRLLPHVLTVAEHGQSHTIQARCAPVLHSPAHPAQHPFRRRFVARAGLWRVRSWSVSPES